ncbi:MAG: LacI family DNA-binding transcriptional regulator [Proteobacteria bacterium]|nr:LacI family DNA-binding transcriptional regulator [Pseudomonadota bacterium]
MTTTTKLPPDEGDAAPRGLRGAVKITDVAAAAGVAPMTVSRVINTPDRVAAPTALRVREAIARLGYVPNMIAGGLSSRRSRMIAAVVPTIAHPMFAEMVLNFGEAMREAGYQVMLTISGYGPENEAEIVRTLLGRRPDALLLTGLDRPPEVRRMLADSALPVVEIWDAGPKPTDMLVGFDHNEVGVAVARLFAGKGHTHFASIGAADSRAQVRIQGYRAEAERLCGVMLPPITTAAPSTIMAGREALRQLLPALNRRTALACSSDLLAFGALTEAQVQGIAVPDRLAICGFGNFELGAACEPPISTVNVEGATIGRIAASFVLERLAGGTTPRRTRVPFRIVERGTT